MKFTTLIMSGPRILLWRMLIHWRGFLGHLKKEHLYSSSCSFLTLICQNVCRENLPPHRFCGVLHSERPEPRDLKSFATVFPAVQLSEKEKMEIIIIISDRAL